MVDVDQMRKDLLTARKARDKVTEVALKRALSAFDNAAAAPVERHDNLPRLGLGVTEVPRLELTNDDYVRIIEAELADAETAAQQYEAGGRAEEAVRLRAECAVLTRYL
jgi:uncharacterized protein YqeY